jgi:hypothetical protein
MKRSSVVNSLASRLRLVAGLVVMGITGATAACVSPVALPETATQFIPPAVFRRWWAMTEACAGRTANFGAVRWYRVPGSTFMSPKGDFLKGYTDLADNKIVLSDTLAAFGAGVRHEMLHAILGVTGHSRDMFLGACAEVVDCNVACAFDGGSWTAPSTWEAVSADTLVVSTEATLLPVESDGDRYLAIRVKARNPLNKAVIAKRPTYTAFQYSLAQANGGKGVNDEVMGADSSTLYFAPKQTKEFLFELRVSGSLSRYTVSPGEYVYQGGFRMRLGATDLVAVTR